VGPATTTFVAVTPASVTTAPDAKPLPVTVTRVPPEVDPTDGVMPVTWTTGGADGGAGAAGELPHEAAPTTMTMTASR
jgi:hypothetical protein